MTGDWGWTPEAWERPAGPEEAAVLTDPEDIAWLEEWTHQQYTDHGGESGGA